VRSNAAGKAVAAADARDEAAAKPRFVAAGSGSARGGPGHELDELSEHFPSFMWVVRDFTLRLEDGGRKINDRQRPAAREPFPRRAARGDAPSAPSRCTRCLVIAALTPLPRYLENALKPQQSFTSEAASRNQIRTLLSSFFRERDCCTLAGPGVGKPPRISTTLPRRASRGGRV